MFTYQIFSGPDKDLLRKALESPNFTVYFTVRLKDSRGSLRGHDFKVYCDVMCLGKPWDGNRYVELSPDGWSTKIVRLMGEYSTKTFKGWFKPRDANRGSTPLEWLGLAPDLLEPFLHSERVRELSSLSSLDTHEAAHYYARHDTVSHMWPMTNEIAHAAADRAVRLASHMELLGYPLAGERMSLSEICSTAF